MTLSRTCRPKSFDMSALPVAVWGGLGRREHTLGLRILCVGENLVDHEPGIRVFLELVAGSAQARRWIPLVVVVVGTVDGPKTTRWVGVFTWFNAAWAAFCCWRRRISISIGIPCTGAAAGNVPARRDLRKRCGPWFRAPRSRQPWWARRARGRQPGAGNLRVGVGWGPQPTQRTKGKAARRVEAVCFGWR